jgi:hypothetical protein
MSVGPRLAAVALPALIVRPRRPDDPRRDADAGHLGAPAAERLYDDVFAWLAAR